MKHCCSVWLCICNPALERPDQCGERWYVTLLRHEISKRQCVPHSTTCPAVGVDGWMDGYSLRNERNRVHHSTWLITAITAACAQPKALLRQIQVTWGPLPCYHSLSQSATDVPDSNLSFRAATAARPWYYPTLCSPARLADHHCRSCALNPSSPA